MEDQTSSQKPLLPAGWQFPSGDKVLDFLERRHFIEIYSLSNSSYIYLFLDPKLQDKIRDRQIDAEFIPIAGKSYPILRFKTHSHAELLLRIDSIVHRKGLHAIAGMDDLKQVLVRDVVHPFTSREVYQKYKLGIPNGILLFGPPGCGKTFIARKLAEELSIPIIEIRESNVGSSYIHATSGNIAKAFSEAFRMAPSMVFIDELSGLIPKRENLSASEKYRESEINEFLMNLESAGSKGVLVVGATNFPERVDSAAMRSGRMDKRIFVPPPDYSARLALFRLELEDRPIEPDIAFEILANVSEGYMASDIKLIVDNAARKALSEGVSVAMRHLSMAIDETSPSLSPEELVQFQKFQQLAR